MRSRYLLYTNNFGIKKGITESMARSYWPAPNGQLRSTRDVGTLQGMDVSQWAISTRAHPGFRGAGSGVRRPRRQSTRRGELFPFCTRYGRTERTQDRAGVSPAKCRDEAAARSAAVTSTLPWC